jgi:8-oxo-dGTP diphosphatase
VPDEFLAATPHVAAGVLFRDADERVLLVKPTYKKGWDIPGGYVEPGESPKQAAVREVAEELGISLPVGRLLVVDWAPQDGEGDKILFVFDGGTIDPSLTEKADVQASEIAELRLAGPDELAGLLPDRLLRRIRGALATRDDAYLEHGEPTSRP